MGNPQNAWFIEKNPMKMDDLGAPLLQETTIWVWLKIGDPIGYNMP